MGKIMTKNNISNIYYGEDEVSAIYYGNNLVYSPSNLTFQNATWSKINELAQAGTIQNYFSVGDEKTIQLSNGDKAILVILGFNHDDLTAGGKAKVSIGMKSVLNTTYQMNPAPSSNAGGWNSSTMRLTTLPSIFNTLPEDLQRVIKYVNKKTSQGSQSSVIITSSDRLWLLSFSEIYSNPGTIYSQEGSIYSYWSTRTTNNDRLKYKYGKTSSTDWWLRSPTKTSDTNFQRITGGLITGNKANNYLGVSFGFCI